MALTDAQIDRLVAAGMGDDEIAALNVDDDEEREQKPRSLSDWKRKARAEEAEKATLAARLEGFEKRETFRDLIVALPEDVRGLVSFDDVKDEPKLTPALLKVKAQEKQEAQQGALMAQAKTFGFEKVEDFQAAMEIAKQVVEQRNAAAAQNQSSFAAQTGFAAVPSQNVAGATVQSQVSQMVDEGNVDGIFAAIQSNPAAFSR